MSLFFLIERFLRTHCPSSSPLLLALSGGPDSLCLFYSLLIYRHRFGNPFHIAHVNHSWRQESQAEAQALQQLAFEHQVPFHLKTLNPTLIEGNLEAACREERYAFFASICKQIEFQGVITGHHQDDQAETIFKRILEGAHWSRWGGLKAESWIQGIRILRPLLTISKDEILHSLAQENLVAFEDPTNHHLHFLRARLRKTIFPRLNQEFGKQVQKNFIEIGEESAELVNFFESRLQPLLCNQLIQGPWGSYLDLQNHLPETVLETKFLLRLLCKNQGFFISREIIEGAAKALQEGKADRQFIMGKRQLWIDRRRIFIVHNEPLLVKDEVRSLEIRPGKDFLGNWKLHVEEDIYSPSQKVTSWKDGWQGHLKSFLPFGKYALGDIKKFDAARRRDRLRVKKRWTQAKVPAFLSVYFPVVWSDGGMFHEFLTGKPSFSLVEGAPCWRIELTYASFHRK
jgi:tRNA(Ile)-lysidine synthase